jgi:hypothetical protein
MPALASTTRRAAPSAATLKKRRDVAKKRLDVDVRLAKDYATIAGLDAKLKQFATDAGESFKEDFGEKGYVSASGAVTGGYKGEVPMVVAEFWRKLKGAQRKQLLKSGLIVMADSYGRASSGRVTVKVL